MNLTETETTCVASYFSDGYCWTFHQEGRMPLAAAKTIVEKSEGLFSELGVLAKVFVNASYAFESALNECGREKGFH